jgi:hypothetical protein
MNTGKPRVLLSDQRNIGIYGEPMKRQQTQHKEKIQNVFITTYFLGDHITDNEMGRACFTQGREEECIQSFGGEA